MQIALRSIPVHRPRHRRAVPDPRRPPRRRVRVRRREAGPVIDHTGRLSLVATASFDEVTAPDVIVVPGGFADRDATPDDPVVQWIPRCTRPRRGRRACAPARSSSRWPACSTASTRRRTGPPTTGCARSARPDRGAGRRAGQGHHRGRGVVGHRHGPHARRRSCSATRSPRSIQLAIEYDPQPPFDSGAPSKASPELLAFVGEIMGEPARDCRQRSARATLVPAVGVELSASPRYAVNTRRSSTSRAGTRPGRRAAAAGSSSRAARVAGVDLHVPAHAGRDLGPQVVADELLAPPSCAARRSGSRGSRPSAARRPRGA